MVGKVRYGGYGILGTGFGNKVVGEDERIRVRERGQGQVRWDADRQDLLSWLLTGRSSL